MHGVEPGEQAPDNFRPFPCRQRAIELADNRCRGFEQIEDVLEGGKTRSVRPEASPALGVQFENTEVQTGTLLRTI